MRENPKPQQIYKHFKGNIYQINCIAYDSETGDKVVVYQALYGDYRYYVRPLEMFMSEVDRTKYPDVAQQYRFELISPVTAEQNTQSAAPQHPTAQQTAQTESPKPAVPAPKPASPQNPMPEEQVNLDPDVEAFLDANTYEKRLEILDKMHYKVTDDMIDIMSTVLDIEIPEGRVSDRYAKFKDALMMRRNYETGRLR